MQDWAKKEMRSCKQRVGGSSETEVTRKRGGRPEGANSLNSQFPGGKPGSVRRSE
jgi:hypothetical protein